MFLLDDEVALLQSFGDEGLVFWWGRPGESILFSFKGVVLSDFMLDVFREILLSFMRVVVLVRIFISFPS